MFASDNLRIGFSNHLWTFWCSDSSLAGIPKPCRAPEIREVSSPETWWAELKARTCGCSLAPRIKRGEDKSIIWMVLPALPIPRSPSTQGPLPFVFWGRGLAAKRAPSPLALCDGVYVFTPPALPWGRHSQPFFDCVTHSWRRVQPEDKSLTACSFFSRRLWGEWSMLCFKASLLSEPQRKRDYKEPI